MKYLVTFIWLCIILSSCNQQHVYEDYKEVKDAKWNYKEQFYFKFEIADTSSYYDVFLNLRNTGEYKFSNIWLNCKQKTPSGLENEQRFEFTLATPDGRWTGNGLGDIIDNQFILEHRVKFKEKGIYTYFVKHEMRDDDINAILNVGLRVKKAGSNKSLP